MKKFQVATLGYPKIGPHREMKWALEKYWNKSISLDELRKVSDHVAKQSLLDQLNAGADIINVGSHTMYDHVLDWAFRFGLIPSRFLSLKEKLHISRDDLYFLMARGHELADALDMTKWFDTNYHNLTPEINPSHFNNPSTDFSDFFTMIYQAIDVIGQDKISVEILGPLTLAYKSTLTDITIIDVISGLCPFYSKLINSLNSMGIKHIQLHEPALVIENFHSINFRDAMQHFFEQLPPASIDINLVTYFEDLGNGFSWITSLPRISTISLDFTRGNNLFLLEKHGFPSHKTLGAGLFDSRSVWNDYSEASKQLAKIHSILKNKTKIIIQPSSSLMFLPYDLEQEPNLNASLQSEFAFAKQKLYQMNQLAHQEPSFENFHNEEKEISKEINFSPEMFKRSKSHEERRSYQLTDLTNNLLLTSTIGSFPQTNLTRKVRYQYKKGLISQEEYFKTIDQYIAFCIGVQEGLDLDILVHGEPERSDMVEYFAEKLNGFHITQNGWVQSYGSRYVRPPIIYKDITRTMNNPMTLREYKVASMLTLKPVKGMLTGPTTIANWSYTRKDISLRKQCFQIALAIRDEICDLEKSGCTVIQVDEPALREGLPLKVSKQKGYLSTAVDSFKLATSVAQPTTHIITHFCYSEFGDIIDSILQMDTDQITIENSRSDNAMLKVFSSFGFKNWISPGVYDVHSPIIPSVSTVKTRLQSFLESDIPIENLMVVPDCGLKTRTWNQAIPSLRNVVTAVKEIRAEKSNKL